MKYLLIAFGLSVYVLIYIPLTAIDRVSGLLLGKIDSGMEWLTRCRRRR